MRTLTLTIIGVLTMAIVQAQDVADALRYSLDEIQGTARFRAMGGAFGALGGDLSAININPAGSVIFNQSRISFTSGIFNANRDVNYFNGFNNASDSEFDVSQMGAAFVFNNYNANSPWKRFSLSMAYDRSADYDQAWVATGVNPTATIGDYFLEYAQGRRLDEISALPGESISEAYNAIGSLYGFGNQQAFLGYEGFIFDPEQDTDDNTAYISNVNGGDFNQQYSYASRGYNGKLAFNFAGSYQDRFYFGVNLNAHFINYDRSTFLRESNSNASSTIRNIDFGNDLFVSGAGFSFQLGGIAKLTEQLRLGLSYTSPTWFRISEETTQFLSSTRLDNGSSVTQTVSPNVINIFPEYRLQSPGRLTTSLAYVFGRRGLISFDYSFRDYSNITFRPTSDVFFAGLNQQINDQLDTANTFRLGGEYRFNRLSLRGGYRFEESPYRDGNFVGDLNGYSFGLGYNFGILTLDFAFSQAQREMSYQLYTVGLTDVARIDTTLTDYILTVGFNF